MIVQYMGVAIPTDFNVEVDGKAVGFGYTVGTNVKYNNRLSFAVRYDSKVSLEFNTNVTTDYDELLNSLQVIPTGQKRRRDLPAVLATGVSYGINDKLLISADFNYYFQKNANWDTTSYELKTRNWSDFAGNASRTGLAASYKLKPNIELSSGINFSYFVYGSETNREKYYSFLGAFEEINDNNLMLGAGVRYHFNKTMSIQGGASIAKFFNKDVKSITASEFMSLLGNTADINVKTWNRVTTFGVGRIIKLTPVEKVYPSL
jgi:long-chain fatty acid transport protein